MTALSAARDLRAFLARHGARDVASASVVLEGLRAVVPSDCAAVSVWDPVAGRHRTLASSFPDDVGAFLDDRMHTDPLFSVVRADGGPVRVRDIPERRRRGPVFDAVIGPLGFRDGVTQCLFSADGRYVGMVNASTLDARHPDDDAVALLTLLGHDLAAALDPLPGPGWTVGRPADGRSGELLLTADGRVVPLSPAARPDLLRAGAPLLALARTARRAVEYRLLVQGSAVHEVELHRTGTDVVVIHREVDPPHGLTARELQVLAGLADGLTNAEIGERLGIGARTVGTHVEHALAKTGSRNRVAAAATAARWGLIGSPTRARVPR
ncbi:LuxR C-terminal-related transcriptional regulator [Actinomycetospora sp. OC33-EN08]|uniref:LuxR C-terminal-related transcriptional regulator n=1 Tax=Actinomycetospora aurantiaca TaxID=3129233 RepID=A0ABU8MM89_9PSEU